MRLKIETWDNDLSVRIPKSLLTEAHIEPGTPVDLIVNDGQIIIKPVSDETYTLEKLLAGVNEDNIHCEVITAKPVGKEVW